MIVKKRIILSIVVLVLTAVIALLAIYFLNLRERKSNPSVLIKNTNELIKDSSRKQTPESIQVILNQLSNKDLAADKKYQALVDTAEYLGSLYNETRAPGIRKYVQEDLKNYAKENFSKYFRPEDFKITCTDPYCGEKIESEMKKALSEIDSNNNFNQDFKDTVKYNLTLAIYIPPENMDEKETGFRLVIWQLQDSGDATASKTAELIKNYYEKKYKIELYKIKK